MPGARTCRYVRLTGLPTPANLWVWLHARSHSLREAPATSRSATTGRWNCPRDDLARQVVDVSRKGPGSRTTLVAGVLDWTGDSPPTSNDLAGRRVVDVGLTRIEAFTKTGAAILGNATVDASSREFASNYRDFKVGATTQVWGWKTVSRKVALAAGEAV
jgi:hypothetical protein